KKPQRKLGFFAMWYLRKKASGQVKSRSRTRKRRPLSDDRGFFIASEASNKARLRSQNSHSLQY
ncbi:MAG: hypothetical protein WCB03_20395, partial [Rouxiella badensis]|uniref:hypothetical protein n=1 Tax=Rouxiella badensis TaxID=1646377 RepID=UPI003C540D1A